MSVNDLCRVILQSLDDPAGQNVVLCWAWGSRWLPRLRGILTKNGLVVIEKNPEEHDKMMAVVQALNHLNTITLGTAIAATGIPLSEINKFSTPIFRAKMEIVKKYSPKARNFTRTSSVKIPILIKCWNSTKKRWLISAV